MDVFQKVMKSFPDAPGWLRLLGYPGSEPAVTANDIATMNEPVLERVANEIARTDWAAEIYDSEWKLQWCSDELKLLLGAEDETELGYGLHAIQVLQRPLWAATVNGADQTEVMLRSLPYVAYDTPGGMPAIRKMIPASARAATKHIKQQQPPPTWTTSLQYLQGDLPPVSIWCFYVRLEDEDGFHGTLRIYGPGLRASVLALVARGDEGMFERMAALWQPGPRRCAVMFADLEQSTKLSRQLSSASYFELLAAFSRAVDDVVVQADGIVGKHVGDGVTAFFLADDNTDPSAAVTQALHAAADIQATTTAICQRFSKELEQEIHCHVNIGLHWGDNLYMGQIVTGGRLEVTALGDPVNEAARIESSAKGGTILVSKQLLEQLSTEDATALGVRPSQRTYTILAEWPDAPSKARRDGGLLPVTPIDGSALRTKLAD